MSERRIPIGRRTLNPDMWLTPREISERLGIHHNTVLDWIKRDGLPAIRVGRGGYYRIHVEDLRLFLRKFYPGAEDEF